jgi:hypothetical protein
MTNDLLSSSHCAAPIFSLENQHNSLLPDIAKKLQYLEDNKKNKYINRRNA